MIIPGLAVDGSRLFSKVHDLTSQGNWVESAPDMISLLLSGP